MCLGINRVAQLVTNSCTQRLVILQAQTYWWNPDSTTKRSPWPSLRVKILCWKQVVGSHFQPRWVSQSSGRFVKQQQWEHWRAKGKLVQAQLAPPCTAEDRAGMGAGGGRPPPRCGVPGVSSPQKFCICEILRSSAFLAGNGPFRSPIYCPLSGDPDKFTQSCYGQTGRSARQMTDRRTDHATHTTFL